MNTTLTPKNAVAPVYRSDIQGLRALAVLGVVLFHTNRDLLPGGFIGVDIFFVISGFLIGGIVLHDKSAGKFSFLEFYAARARRIFPAYFFMLAIVSIITALIYTTQDFSFYWKSLKSALYFSSNNYFANSGDYFAPSSNEAPLLHTWSLAVEMQFYFLLPALLIALPNRAIKPTLAFTLLVFLAIGLQKSSGDSKEISYFSLWTRIPEFLTGVLLASKNGTRGTAGFASKLPHLNDWMSLLGLAMIFYGFLAINEGSNYPGWLVVFPCIGAGLIIACRGAWVSAILSAPPLVWIGGLSYSLYIWHWPILALTRYVTEQYELNVLLLLMATLLFTTLAYMSLRWIEMPFRHSSRSIGARRWRVIASVPAVAALVLLSPRINASVEPPLPVSHTRYADPTTICHGSVIGDCVRGSGKHTSPPTLVLGDSHAAQLNLFFDHVGATTGKDFKVISASSCVTIPGFDIERLPEWARERCAQSIKYAEKHIPAASELVIAAMWQYQLLSPKFVSALNKFLKQCHNSGKRVTLLWQVPMLSSNIQRLRRLETFGFQSTIRLHPDWKEANLRVAEIAEQHSNVTFIEFSSSQLFSSVPFYKGQLIYQDSHHLNEIGAAIYAKIAQDNF